MMATMVSREQQEEVAVGPRIWISDVWIVCTDIGPWIVGSGGVDGRRGKSRQEKKKKSQTEGKGKEARRGEAR